MKAQADTVFEISDRAVLELRPTASVLITTFNQQEFIADAIQGVLNQETSFPIELIIGEDCSTDATRSIVIDFQKRFPGVIRVILGDTNVGAFQNSNRCFERVRGEFLAYCEGDDYWHDTGKLQKQVDHLRAHPACGLVHSDFDYLIYNFGAWRLVPAKSRPKRPRVPQGKIYKELLGKMSVRTCTMMGRTQLLREHYHSNLRSTTHAVGDRPIVLHMSKLADIDYIDEPLATYRRTPGSMTNVGHARLLQQVVRKLDMYRNFRNAFGAEPSEWLYMQKVCHRESFSIAFLAGSVEIFTESHAWLSHHDNEYCRRISVRLMVLVFGNTALRQFLIRSKLLFNEIRLFLKSRRVAT